MSRRSSQSLILTLVASLLFGALPTQARADLMSVPSAEQEADALQQAFSSEYELFNPKTGESLDAPLNPNADVDWDSLLRSGVRTRVSRRGEPPVYKNVIPKVQYGLVLTGPKGYREGADSAIAPASTSKIFTSTLALKELGPNFTYSTRVLWKENGSAAGYLQFIGTGDPTLQPEKLAALVSSNLIKNGVKKLYGDIQIEAVDSRWENKVIPEGWRADDRASIIPGPLGLIGKNGLKQIIKKNLLKAGVTWEDEAAPTFSDASATSREAVWTSKPLREMIKPFMLLSLNTLGEGFLRKVGEVKGSKSAPDLLSAALPLLRDWAARNVGSNSVTLNDGCGLSRTSRVTANALVTFLTEMKSETFFADFEASMPIAGDDRIVDGYSRDLHRTLHSRMKGTPAEGTIHAKTGTLNNPNGNYQLAGYLVETNGGVKEYHPFTILTQTDKSNSSYAREAEDKVLSTWARLVLN